jgi:ankyrin repeat protein
VSPRLLIAPVIAGWALGGALAAATDAPLVDGVRRGDLAAVRAEIQRGADVNAPEPDGTTALHWAAYQNEVEIAGALIRARARVDAANRYGVQPLSLAASGGHAAIVRLLLDAGAGANTTTGTGETALMGAARSGSVEAVNALLARGAVVDARESSRNQTALMWAAAEGHPGVVRALVKAGADVKAQSKSGFTPLLFAAREGHITTVGTLLELGSTLDESLAVSSAETAGGVAREQREASLDAFLLAAGNAHFELAAYLLDRGANPNAAPRGWTALHQVSWVRKMGEVGGNDPPPQGSGGMGSLEFVKKLVAGGADVNARATSRRLPVGASGLNFAGATPFFLAARTADLELMRLLLELGADPKLATAEGTTPLMVAAGVGSSLPGEEPGTEAEALEAVKMTLALGDDINAIDANGDTAMHGAAYKHLPAVAQFLGDAGARVEVWNQRNKDGFTPLQIAAGIQRGMNFVFSRETEAVIRRLLGSAGAPAAAARP